MQFYSVKLRSWFVLLGILAGLGTAVYGDDWAVYRFEGRDYVSLENIAAFYGFPAPPPLDPALLAPTSKATPAPSVPAKTPALPVPAKAPASPVPAKAPAPAVAAQAPAPATEEPPPADTTAAAVPPTESKSITLDNGKSQLTVTPNGRETEINGVKQWLAFPATVQGGKLLISRLDLAKTIEPRLRPEKVTGLLPVTTVILDPGHGGHDNGAVSRYGFEKDFALDVALRARQILEKRGFKVLMTRSADIFIPLHERAAVANHVPDSIFVSIHFNSATSNPAARGFEIYSCAPRGAPATNDGFFAVRDLRDEPGNAMDTQSSVLSGTIFHSLLGHVPLPDRGIKHARFAVLRLCSQPAVLVECGFVSNSADSALIATPEWREQVAASIVTGIEGYKELAELHQAPKMVADYRKAGAADSGAQ